MKTKLGYLGSLFSLAFSATFIYLHIHFLSLLFLTLAVIAFIFAIYAKNKTKQGINLKEFTFIDPPGYYTHPKYSYPLSPHCLIDKGRISPVSKVDEDAWYCNVCNKPLSGTRGAIFTVDW